MSVEHTSLIYLYRSHWVRIVCIHQVRHFPVNCFLEHGVKGEGTGVLSPLPLKHYGWSPFHISALGHEGAPLSHHGFAKCVIPLNS